MPFGEYSEKANREELIRSTVSNIVAVLGATSNERHKRDLLDICIWQITEVDGKWNTRFRSEGAMIKEDWGTAQHEHVFQRKILIDRLIRGEDIYSVVRNAIPCIVTRTEHKILSDVSRDSQIDGWERYKVADITVFDLKNDCEYDFT